MYGVINLEFGKLSTCPNKHLDSNIWCQWCYRWWKGDGLVRWVRGWARHTWLNSKRQTETWTFFYRRDSIPRDSSSDEQKDTEGVQKDTIAWGCLHRTGHRYQIIRTRTRRPHWALGTGCDLTKFTTEKNCIYCSRGCSPVKLLRGLIKNV